MGVVDVGEGSDSGLRQAGCGGLEWKEVRMVVASAGVFLGCPTGVTGGSMKHEGLNGHREEVQWE